MTTQTTMFSLDNLSVFERPGATVEKREDHYHAGCWVRFENGWTVSIQWGNGNYGDNYNRVLDAKPEDSTRAEVAVWKGEHADLIRWKGGDTVLPYVPMKRVQGILDLAAADTLAKMWTPPPEPPPEPELQADDGSEKSDR